MIDNYNIVNIYKVLLNRNPTNTEILKAKNSNINDLKFEIKATNEFKDFKEKNITKIKEGLGNIINHKNPKFNYENMLKSLIAYNYNYDKFYEEFKRVVKNIQERTERFYFKHLNIRKQLKIEDLVDIINNNYELEFYIPTSDDFVNESRKKIVELTSKLG